MGASFDMFAAGAVTHPGHVRSRNEDAMLVRSDIGLWAVADGMGGHDAGDIASQIVIQTLDTISAAGSAAQLLADAELCIAKANRQIIEISGQRGVAIMGSTVVILLISEDHFACLWAGDSRLYLVRNNILQQVSRDHTEVEEMLASGAMSADEARNWPQNVITRAVGVHDSPELEIITGAFEPADSFILCSDGLTRHVSDEEIRQLVASDGAQAASDALVELALARGGDDNITVIVVQPQNQSSPDETTIRLADERTQTDIWE